MLVELAIVWQMDLRHDAEQAAVADRQRAIVEPMAPSDRRSDEEQGAQPTRGLDQTVARRGDGIEQRVLHEQVVDGVGRKRQLGEDRERGTVVVARLPRRQDRVGVGLGIADASRRGAGGDANEAVIVERTRGHRSMIPHTRTLCAEARGIAGHHPRRAKASAR